MRRLSTLDLLVLGWVLLCLLLGAKVAGEVRDLAGLSDTVVDVGRQTQAAGDGLAAAGSLPVIGAAVKGPAERVRQAGREAEASGRESRRSTENLGLLLGLAVALVPTVPVLAVYLPGRLAAERERRTVRRALAGRDPREVEALLAWRAATGLAPAEVLAITPTPLADLEAGRHRALADAELARLGVSRPAAGT